jgi:LmbE family N-acetylglucosaminyl deacetylase
MKKIIFGIFAHPDDEAFGPAGTLIKETRSGTELHLITLTNGGGSHSVNVDNHADLGAVRLEEWHKAGQLLGAASMEHLGYQDGQLNNDTMIEIADKLARLIFSKLNDAPADAEVEFMAFDLNGLTGHIDHIVASRAACWTFYKLKAKDSRLKRIRLYCFTDSEAPSPNIDWIYMEQGHAADEIGETVDARSYHNEILEVMRAHHTQRQDAAAAIQNRGDNLGLNHFLIKN